MRKTAILISVILVLFSVQLYAQTTGVLKGQVKDNNGQPVPLANVVLYSDGSPTPFGIQTDEDGEYIIINITPGVYDLEVSLVGYKKVVYEGIEINVMQTTKQDARIQPGDNTLEAVKFTAKKDKIQNDRVGTSSTVEVGDMEDLSVDSVDDILALQPGVTSSGGEIRVRGSRANEVNMTVDGMSVSDPVDGGSALEVDTDAIADMKVYTGALTAEFGNAQSGMVNIVTKSGSAEYSGKIEAKSDHMFIEGNNNDVVKFAFGGPVLGGLGASKGLNENFTFFINGAGSWSDGFYKDYWESDPNEDFFYDGVSLIFKNYNAYDTYGDRDDLIGIDVGERHYNSYNLNFKTRYKINNNSNLTFAVRGDRSVNEFFAWAWKYALDYYVEAETEQKQYVLTFDQNISKAANLKLKASYFVKDSYQGPKGITRDNFLRLNTTTSEVTADSASVNQYVTDIFNYDMMFYDHPAYVSIDANHDGVFDYNTNFYDSDDWLYQTENGQELIPGYVAPGSIYGNFIDDKTSSINLRGDVEWAINQNNTAKTGFEFIKYNIEKNQLLSFNNIYNDRRTDYLNNVFSDSDIPANATEEDIAQIVSENENVIAIEAGAEEGQYLIVYSPETYYAAAKASSGTRDGYKADPIQGAYYLQDQMEWEALIVTAGLRFDFWYIGEDYDVLQDDGTYRTFSFDGSDKFQMMVSPRVGISHPISERDALRFAYNYQNQLPPMRYIFTSKTPEDAQTADQTIQVGNAELDPQVTITYEVGLQHLINEDWVADISVYYKNYYNYPSTRKVNDPDEQQVFWYEYISEDYASGRGVDLSLQKVLSNFWSAGLSYSFAWAEGNNSSVVIQDENTNLREFPLDWDIRNNLSANFLFKIDKGEEFFVPFTNYILPIDDFSTSLTYSYASGEPYTPQDPITDSYLDTNSERKDATQNTSLKITKNFRFGQKSLVRVYLDVDNLFKNRNINNVYAKTGDPYDTGEDYSVNGYDIPEILFAQDQYTRDPGRVSQDRTITLGVSYNF